ncbi:MarR family transcriptional regulator [Bacillus sp. BHET2]|uniref:MarR family winged helix-turn-helix transcriptional regulator n=1 Tax=Bacillus sp. BHET2 TaxID=2583818 RepID=UPI00110DC0A2|nr:MarR family transcriptional regulator [Bacillus sp. BHET2]TMU87208.1 MarR family transcriptional regulator [Bacillus sp. BHET2]
MKPAQEFFQELIRLYRPFENQLNVQLSGHGLHRAQWTILYNLYHNGPASSVEISHYQSVEKPTITRTVHQLEEAGYIERIPGKDRREKRIQLTKLGVEVYEDVRKTIDRFEQGIMEGISEEKQIEMIELMKQIKGNMKG